jgi:hypothetical protein
MLNAIKYVHTPRILGFFVAYRKHGEEGKCLKIGIRFQAIYSSANRMTNV